MAGSAKGSHPYAVQLTDRLFHATSAMRAMIARKALEELAGAPKAGRVRAEKEKMRKRSASRSPQRRSIDLSYPAPPQGRPATASGATSFHFAISSASKVRPSPESGGKAVNAALNFERYVTDLNAGLLDRAAATERYVVGDHGDHAGGSRTAFVISNISNNAAEREAFWTAANDAASTPSQPRLEVRAGKGEVGHLRSLADSENTPGVLAKALHDTAEAIGAGGDALRNPTIHRIDLDTAAFAWAKELDYERFGTRRDERLLHLVRPRGGVLQFQVETEFPAELDDADNYAIAKEFGDALDEMGLKFTIAAHEPTHRNDVRNRHPHILFYPGACTRRDDGSWDFSGRKIQPGTIAVRLGEIDARALAKLRFEQRYAADVNALRQRFADIVNAKLAQRYVRRRYDPRSYKEMGIDQAPGEHLGSAAAALVAAGYSVEIDQRNAMKGWAGRQRQAAERIAAERDANTAVIVRIDAADPDRSDIVLVSLRQEQVALASRFIDLLEAESDFDLHNAMARSAAERLAGSTAGILHAVESGSSSAAEARALGQYRARNEIALAHLDAIDDAIEPHAEGIEAARDEIVAARARLRAIEQEVRAHIEQRDRLAAKHHTAEKWAAETVLMPAKYPVPLLPDVHFEALIEHLRNQRQADWRTPGDRVIHVTRASASEDRFEASGLRPADRALVSRQPYLRRFNGALRTAGLLQEIEIKRVLEYIAAHGEVGLALGASDDAHRTVRRDYQLFQQHPLFCRLLPEARARFEAAQAARRMDDDRAGTRTVGITIEPRAEIMNGLSAAAPRDRNLATPMAVTPVAVPPAAGTGNEAAAAISASRANQIPPVRQAREVAQKAEPTASTRMPDDAARPDNDIRVYAAPATEPERAKPLSDVRSDAPEPEADAARENEPARMPVSSHEGPPAGGGAAADESRPTHIVPAPIPAPETTLDRKIDKRAKTSVEHLRDVVRAKSHRRSARDREPSLSHPDRRVLPTPAITETTPARPEPVLLEPVRERIARFRERPLYARLVSADRQAFDASLQGPMNDLVHGRVVLRTKDGALQAAAVPDSELDSIRALAQSDPGYWLLADLAEHFPAAAKAPGEWHVIERGDPLGIREPLGRQGPGIGD